MLPKVPLDKAERTILHKTVRALYPLLESATVEPAAAAAAASTSGSSKPEHKNIVIKHAKKTGGKNNSSVCKKKTLSSRDKRRVCPPISMQTPVEPGQGREAAIVSVSCTKRTRTLWRQ